MIADTLQDKQKTFAPTYSRSHLVSHIEQREASQDIREAMLAQSASEYIDSYEEVSQ